MSIACKVIYKSDEIGGTMPCPHIHWATNVKSVLAAEEYILVCLF